MDKTEAFPAILQQKVREAGLDFEVVNAGLSGDTTAGGVRRVDWALGKGAAVLVLELGGNDGLRGTPPAETKRNLTEIIRKARAKSPDIRILVAGMQMPGNMGADYAEAYNAVFAEVAKEQNTALVPFLLEGIGGVAEFNQPDLIHPTAEGQKRVAETVWKVLGPVLQTLK